MTLNLYKRGALVRVTAAFVDVSGAAVDPTTVKLKYRAPSGAPVTLIYGTDAGVVKDSVGNYHCDIDTTSAFGIWRYRWEASGTGQSANEGQFTVVASALD